MHFTLFTLLSIPLLGLFWFLLLLMNAAPVGEMFLSMIPVLFVAFLFMSAWCLFRVARGLESRARAIRVGILCAAYPLGTIGGIAFVFLEPFAGNILRSAAAFLACCALLAIADVLSGLKKLPDLG